MKCTVAGVSFEKVYLSENATTFLAFFRLFNCIDERMVVSFEAATR